MNDLFFEVIKKRRSVRKFTHREVPESVKMKAFQSAILAPNSSNTQTWDFYWIQSENKKQKLIPFTYHWGFFNSLALIKWLIACVISLFRPLLRGPHSKAELQLVAVKSAALAAENFVLSLASDGVGSCMMEGFDEARAKQLLELSGSARIVMVIGIGYQGEGAFWGPQYRLPLEEVLHRV